MGNENKYEMNAQEWMLNAEDLATNSAQRAPIIICVDCSYSMLRENRLEKVLKGLEGFRKTVLKDRLMKESAELCLISYQGETAKEEIPFTQIDRFEIPRLTAKGETPLAAAVNLALDQLESRLNNYSLYGIKSILPTLIIIGDGDDTGSSKNLKKAAERLKKSAENHEARVLCVTVGDKDSKEFASLKKLAPNHKVYYLQDLEFNHFFRWLSISVERASQSLEGEEIDLLEGMEQWAVDAEE